MPSPHWPSPLQHHRRGLGATNAASTLANTVSSATGVSANDVFQQALSTSGVTSDQAADLTGLFDQAQSIAAAPQAQQLFGSISAMASGGQPSMQDISGAATAAATAGLLAAGMSLSAATGVMAPMAALVFGGGELMSAGICSLLGGPSCGNWPPKPEPCNPNAPPLSSTDPNWVTYVSLVTSGALAQIQAWARGSQSLTPDPSLAVPNCYSPNMVGAYALASDGPFENWVRPIWIRYAELGFNCKPVPGPYPRAFIQGLIDVWNAQFPLSTMKEIYNISASSAAIADDALEWDATNAKSAAFEQECQLTWLSTDPVQNMIAAMQAVQYGITTESNGYLLENSTPSANETPGNIPIVVAEPSIGEVQNWLNANSLGGGIVGTVANIAVGAAAVGGASLVASVAYGLATKKDWAAGYKAIGGLFKRML